MIENEMVLGDYYDYGSIPGLTAEPDPLDDGPDDDEEADDDK